MAERYDPAAAAHYAAYRPPLHSLILGRALPEGASFRVGVDVGCGTGYSALALAERCARVYGVDPSAAMLAQATPHERVAYLAGSAERLPLADGSVEIATFAGSLFYADAAAAAVELRRVCRPDAVVVAYDFEILLDGVLRRRGVVPAEARSDYDHRAGFEGEAGLTRVGGASDRVTLRVAPAELAHLLLSDSHRLDRLAERYGAADPFPALAEELRLDDEGDRLEAEVHHSTYRVSPRV